MKNVLNILIYMLLTSHSRAGDVPQKILNSFRTIITLIKNDRTSELSELIVYPIKRGNPIPDIMTQKEFISYYPILFDDSFKNKLLSYNDSDIFEHYLQYGLVGGSFTGDIWINENGKIISVNYISSEELKLATRITKQIQCKIHPDVKPWKKNIVVCNSEKFLVRVDLMDDNKLRYVSWSKPKQINDKPDLILFNGVQEFQGTMGGVTFTFQNNDYYYQIDDKKMAEHNDLSKIGYFLRIFKSKDDLLNYKPSVNYKCRPLK